MKKENREFPSVASKMDEEDVLLAKQFSAQVVLVSDEQQQGGCPQERTTTQSSTDEAGSSPSSSFTILCDLGYGLPKESRPRKEKLLSISKQLVNFLLWQQAEKGSRSPASIKIVLENCDDNATTIEQSLRGRMEELWNRETDDKDPFPPGSVSFTNQPLLELVVGKEVTYLSPDATETLDLSQPPATVVVGLLIDRRIQANRSVRRAAGLGVRTARWPLEELPIELDKNEPLNVDCVLEGMQQWYWNWQEKGPTDDGSEDPARARFAAAAVQAIRRHQRRHPVRPRHKA
jgi:hypothetical protein